MMRSLLLISQDFPPDVGGIQTYAAELASRLAPRVEEFAAVAPARPGADAVDASLPFPVYRLPARPDLLPLVALPALPVIARQRRSDLTLHTQWQTVGAALLARTFTGSPRRILCAAHGRELLFNPFSSGSLPHRAYNALRRFVVVRTDHFVPVSRYTAGLLRALGVPPERMTVLPNGTDPTVFAPCEASPLRQTLELADRRVLLTVGRLVPRKGIDTTLRALPRIAEVVPDVTYLVVGDGPDRERLHALARRLNVAERVHFVGEVPDDRLPLYYNACDVFVMPSRDDSPDVEGFGIVFLEAGACEKPVIGARAGGVPDAVRDGETGLLVPPCASRAVAQAAIELLTRPAYAERLGQEGRRRVLREATWERVADRMYEVITRLG